MIPPEVQAEILVGADAEEFVKSELGQKLIEMARMEVDAAALDMKEVDLKDEKKLREIQNRIWRATQFEGWLQEIIFRGREALETNKE